MPGGSNPATTTQETSVKLSPEQQKLMSLAMPGIEQYASKPLEQYSGSAIAGFNPNEVAAQNAYLDQAAPTGGALATQAAGTQSKLLDPGFMLDVGNNQYLQGAMSANADILTQSLLEQALPQVSQGATQAGGMYSGGSSREGIAQGQAIGRTADAISRSNAGMLMDAYSKGLSGMQTAVSANPGVQAQQLFAPDVMASVGGQQRAMDQAMLDEQVNKFYTAQQLPYLQSKDILSLVQGLPGATNVSQVTGAVPKPNMLSAGLGGAASGAALGSFIPGVGTGVGAGLGLLASILSNR